MAMSAFEQLDAAIEFVNHLYQRVFPLRGLVRIKMTLVFHCMLQNDPARGDRRVLLDSLGVDRKKLARGRCAVRTSGPFFAPVNGAQQTRVAAHASL